MGLLHPFQIPPLRTAADVAIGLSAGALSTFAKRLTAETTPVDPTRGRVPPLEQQRLVATCPDTNRPGTTGSLAEPR